MSFLDIFGLTEDPEAQRKRAKFRFWSGVALVALNVPRFFIGGIHFNLNAALLLAVGVYGLGLSIFSVRERPESTRWWNKIPVTSLFFAEIVLMPFFLWFVCFTIIAVEPARWRIGIYSFSLLVVEAMLTGSLIQRRRNEEKTGINLEGRLFDARAFSIALVGMLILGSAFYLGPKPRTTSDPGKDLKALDRSLDEIKLSITLGGK